MSKRRKKPGPLWFKITGSVFLLLAFAGFAGFFGISKIRPLYGIFELLLGNFALAGLFLCLAVGILFWISGLELWGGIGRRLKTLFAKPDDKNTGNEEDEEELLSEIVKRNAFKKASQSPGKLVDVKGFDNYFSSTEFIEMKEADSQRSAEMEEIGKDFNMYFGTNGRKMKRPAKIVTLSGLKSYIEGVDREESRKQEAPRQERSRQERPRQEIFRQERPKAKPFPEKKNVYSSVFSSPEEQKEFLAPFKDNYYLPDPDEQRFLNALKEGARICDVLESADGNGDEEPEIQYPKASWTQWEDGKNQEGKEKINFDGYQADYEYDNDGVFQDHASFEDAFTADDTDEMYSTDRIDNADNIDNSDFAGAVFTDETDDTDEADDTYDTANINVSADNRKKSPPDSVYSGALIHNLNDLGSLVRTHWKLPGFNLLDSVLNKVIPQDPESRQQLEKVLLDFGVKAKVIRVTRGPVITRYEVAPAPGVKISKIVSLADDIALALAARDVRIEAPIPGKSAIGIEVPNKQPRSVPFREVLETKAFRAHSSKLKVALGKDIADQPVVGDLISMHHLLVAGATGSGKSVCITSIINSILFDATPQEVKLLLVDPKMVELSQYNGIPHLIAPVVVDPKKAASALKWIVTEMDNRYSLFAAAGVRDIERYNNLKAGGRSYEIPALPFVVVIIDELADLMMVATMDVEEAIARLAQKARAAGIHLVIATQRPSVDVITGVIKANIPSRISFAVSSQIDSRTILDATGAEKLLGRGDMLYSPAGINKPVRVQGCLITDEEVQRLINYWKNMGTPEYLDPQHLFADTTGKNEESNGPDDVLFYEAGELFIKTGMASVSYLQRKLKLGYTRASRLMDLLQEQGVVGGYEGSKPRQVLLTLEEFKERFR